MTEAEKPPFLFVRALLVTVPLAILVGTVVSPSDPVVQMLLIAGALIGGLPIAYRLVAVRRYGPIQLGMFFGVVLIGTLLGLWGLQRVGADPLPDVLLRLLIVLLSLLVADLVVFRLR